MAARKVGKPSAADRTIDLFSGKTSVEALENAKRIAEDADIAEANLAKGGIKPMEEEADRWRAQTFSSQEWMSKNFPIAKGERASQFRLTRATIGDQDWYYLEELHSYSGKTVSSYRGMMCRDEDFPALVECIAAAWKARKQ